MGHTSHSHLHAMQLGLFGSFAIATLSVSAVLALDPEQRHRLIRAEAPASFIEVESPPCGKDAKKDPCVEQKKADKAQKKAEKEEKKEELKEKKEEAKEKKEEKKEEKEAKAPCGAEETAVAPKAAPAPKKVGGAALDK